ncbi:hypothetical protein [Actinoplanes philippinensis]|uniref:hypothetical protein n=1 Tax=Actinoplanes philippinensis TaxID=35752 RepID=UPI0033F35377
MTAATRPWTTPAVPIRMVAIRAPAAAAPIAAVIANGSAAQRAGPAPAASTAAASVIQQARQYTGDHRPARAISPSVTAAPEIVSWATPRAATGSCHHRHRRCRPPPDRPQFIGRCSPEPIDALLTTARSPVWTARP